MRAKIDDENDSAGGLRSLDIARSFEHYDGLHRANRSGFGSRLAAENGAIAGGAGQIALRSA